MTSTNHLFDSVGTRTPGLPRGRPSHTCFGYHVPCKCNNTDAFGGYSQANKNGVWRVGLEPPFLQFKGKQLAGKLSLLFFLAAPSSPTVFGVLVMYTLFPPTNPILCVFVCFEVLVLGVTPRFSMKGLFHLHSFSAWFFT